jgi:type I restriction enzyme M protein
VLSRRKPAARKDKIVLLNASKRVKKGRPKNYIPEDAIRPLAAAYLKGEPVEGEVAVITREQAEEGDYNLSPSRWVSSAASGAEADLKDILHRFDVINAAEAAISEDLNAVLAKLRELA